MALHISSIVSTEVSEAKDDKSVIDWLQPANYALGLQGATKAPRSATNVRLALMFGPRITRICRKTTGEYILQTLEYLLKAREYGFTLEYISDIVAKASADFIDERNDKHKNRYNYPANPGEDSRILEKIKAIGLTKYPTLQSDIARLERIVKEPVPEVPFFNFEVDNVNLTQTNPVFSGIAIKYIQPSEVQIITRAFFARRLAHFQVAVHIAWYNGRRVAVKFEEVEIEVRCLQYLSTKINNDNCFIQYHGTYVEGHSLNLVMDYYEKDLMSVITAKANDPTPLHEQTLAGIFMKLLTSFAEMEALRIFHGDIKPHNILTDDNWNMKIIDFSVSVIKNTDMTDNITGINPVQGTIGYMAPELEALRALRQNTGTFSPEKADVFSLGIVFLQILTLKKLEGLNTFDKSTTLMNMVGSLQCDWAKRLLGPMLASDYRQRPRFRDCFQYIGMVVGTLTMKRG